MNQRISNHFFNEGIILDFKNKNPFHKIGLMKELYNKYGILIINNFIIKPKNLKKFTDNFTSKYSNDAVRRRRWFNENTIRSVDSGNHEIPLHSESSFTSVCPQIMWFYGLDVNIKNCAPTTICDGIKVWDKLEINNRKKFLHDPLIYKVQIKLAQKSKNIPNKKWYLDNIGIKNPIINFKKSYLNFEFVKFAVNFDENSKKISFCNHILSVNDEKQIKKCHFYSKKILTQNILKQINRITKNLTYEHEWKNNQLIMLNNNRFLHGRRAIPQNQKRIILNIQTLISNF